MVDAMPLSRIKRCACGAALRASKTRPLKQASGVGQPLAAFDGLQPRRSSESHAILEALTVENKHVAFQIFIFRGFNSVTYVVGVRSTRKFVVSQPFGASTALEEGIIRVPACLTISIALPPFEPTYLNHS
eukprot:4117823-Pleurochrysis_carterae.AAC.5